MADINNIRSPSLGPSVNDGSAECRTPCPNSTAISSEGKTDLPSPDVSNAQLEIIELLFFAYRDFIADPDAVLNEYGFGRAHHRVLHFVYNRPGLRVSDLLQILKITKQSLSRVLKQLIDGGFIRQDRGAKDRRERPLYATLRGADLANRLMHLQAARIDKALQALDKADRAAICRFLTHMINTDQPPYLVKHTKDM